MVAIAEDATSTLTRVAGVLRDVARGGLSGLLAGTLVGGIGGRIVMSAAAVINPQATGHLTSNGELIGRFTVNGTLALMIFGGLGAGMAAGVLWVVVSPWIPWRGPRRWLLVGVLALAFGGSFLIESQNADFVILDQVPVLLVMLAGLVVLVGIAVAWLDELLERRMSRPSGRFDRALAGSILVAFAGLLPLAFTVLAYLSPSFSDRPRPPWVGIALLVAGAATAVLWLLRIRGAAVDAPALVRLLGVGGVFAAAALGGLHLVGEAARILAL